jgi:hypothetical protein
MFTTRRGMIIADALLGDLRTVLDNCICASIMFDEVPPLPSLSSHLSLFLCNPPLLPCPCLSFFLLHRQASNVQMNSLLNVFVVVLTGEYKVQCFTLALTEFAKPDAETIYNKVVNLCCASRLPPPPPRPKKKKIKKISLC